MAQDFLSAIQIVVVVSSIAFVAVRLSAWTEDGISRVLAGAVIGLADLVGIALLTGMVGVLSRWWLVAAHLVVAVLVAVGTARAESVGTEAQRLSLAGMFAIAVGTAVASLSFVPTVGGRLSGESDTRNYHLVNLVEWVRRHSIWELPFQNIGSFTATHPGNGELAAAFFITATGSDQLVYLTPLLFGAWVVIASSSAVRDLGGVASAGALVSLAVLATPIAFTNQTHSLATDAAGAGGLVAAVACLLRARNTQDHRWILLAGCALGIGVGSKYTILIPGALVALSVLVLFRRKGLWVVPGLVFFALPWFVRNLVTTGNPVFPQQIDVGETVVFEGGFAPVTQLSTTIAEHFLAMRTEIIQRWADLVWTLIGPVLVLAVAAPILVLLFRRNRRDHLAVGLLAIVCAATYAVTPYTGSGPEGLEFLMGSALRYAIPFLLIGGIVTIAIMPVGVSVSACTICLAFAAWRIIRGAGFRNDLDMDAQRVVVAAVGAGAVVLVALAWGKIASRPRRVRALLALVAVASVLAVAGAIRTIDTRREVSELESLVRELNVEEILVLSVTDHRSLITSDLDVELATLSAGGRADERPILDPGRLDTALRRSTVNALAVTPNVAEIPEGWSPDERWALRGKADGVELYMRER